MAHVDGVLNDTGNVRPPPNLVRRVIIGVGVIAHAFHHKEPFPIRVLLVQLNNASLGVFVKIGLGVAVAPRGVAVRLEESGQEKILVG